MADEKARSGDERASPRERLSGEGSPASQYYAAFLLVGLVTMLDLALASYAGYWSAAILYLAAISLSAVWLGSGPVIFAAVLSAATWDYFFIPPRFTFTISRTEDVLMLALYLFVSICSGLATSRLRASERLLRDRGEQLSAIGSLAGSLVAAGSVAEILSLGLDAIRRTGACEAIAILGEDGTRLKTRPEDGWEPLDGYAREAAARCFEDGSPTGRFTPIVSSSEWYFLPLDSPKGRLGVIGARPAHDADRDGASLSRIAALTSTVALALSRELGPRGAKTNSVEASS